MSVRPYMEPCGDTTRASKDDKLEKQGTIIVCDKIYVTKNLVRNEHESIEKPMPHNLTTRFLSSSIRFELFTRYAYTNLMTRRAT